MNAAYAYLQIYRLFDSVTPTAFDCGRFCKKACCKGDSDSGMYLFPCEESVYSLLDPDWARITDTDFTYEYKGRNKTVNMLICDGHCDRYQRPLACRIFPLTPYIDKKGHLSIITDPRAKAVCPLTDPVLENDLNPLFVSNVRKICALLDKNSRVHAFFKAYSRLLDEYSDFFI